MPSIQYKESDYTAHKDESLLDVFLRHGIEIPFSCKNGICQSCLMRSVSAAVIPEKAQRGLRQNLIDKHYFKACSFFPAADIEVEDARAEDMFVSALIAKKEILSPEICRLLIEPASTIDYRPGQFVNLRNKDGELRSYSLSSVPPEDYYLQLHIKKVAGGLFSDWIFKDLAEGDEVEIQGGNGDCCYNKGSAEQPLLLIGTGVGVSPLIGIVRDALLNEHKADIYLYHGSRTLSGLFLDKELTDLQEQYPQFHYIPCVSGAGEILDSHCTAARANDTALAQHTELSGWQVFLCGQPDMVQITRKEAEVAGAAAQDIKSDPFWSHEQEKTAGKDQSEFIERRKYPRPDAQMWQALGEGKILTKVLHDFYDRVYKDPALLGFFDGTTKQRSIEKQYSFTYQVFTGENVYFGERPRNAHHWMVISDELYDYRQGIMADCLRLHGVAQEFIDRWMQMENLYRDEIVKHKPWNLIKFGKEVPLDGFEELTMDSATLCDNCQAEVNVGDVVRYHTRLGKIYCRKCMSDAK